MSDKFIIESEVPLPKIVRAGAGNRNSRGSKYPFADLEVGQSVKGIWLKAASSLSMQFKKLAPKTFAVRRLGEDVDPKGRKHFGVWRTA